MDIIGPYVIITIEVRLELKGYFIFYIIWLTLLKVSIVQDTGYIYIKIMIIHICEYIY